MRSSKTHQTVKGIQMIYNLSFPLFIRVFEAVAFGELLVYYKYATPTDLIDLLILRNN